MDSINKIFLFLIVFFAESYAISVRDRAVKHKYEGLIDNVVEAFVESYYRMPASLEEISEFCADYRKTYSSYGTMIGMFKERMEGLTPEEYVMAKYVKLESFADSCFIYDRKHKIGCCIYGTPCFWINRNWQKSRNFKPSFFDENGKYLFLDLQLEFVTGIKSLTKKYNCIIKHIEEAGEVTPPYNSNTISFRERDTVSYQAIMRYESSELKPLCGLENTTHTLMLYSASTKEYSNICGDADLSDLCNEYFTELRQYLDLFVAKHRQVKSIIFRTGFYL